jgi:type I restriction enzyme S subunit
MVPYLRAANVKDGRLDLTEVKEMNFTPAEQQAFSLRRGDVLVSEGAGSLAAVGAAAVWDGSIGGVVCFQNTLLRLRPRNSTTRPRFLAWWARHAYASRLLASAATGVNIYHLSAERVRSLPVAFPAPQVQDRIVNFLDRETARIDGLIVRRRQLLDLLAERRAEARRRAFSVDPNGAHRVSWLPPIPLEWPILPLRWVTRCLDGSRIPLNAEQRSEIPGDFPYWGANGIVDHVHDYLFDEELVLLGEDGAPFFDREKDVSFFVDERVWVNNHIHVLRPVGVRPRFLAHYLNLVDYSAFITGTTRDKLTQEEMGRIPVPIPREEDQRRIEWLADKEAVRSEQLSRLVRTQIILLREHRQVLITAVIAGQIDLAETG